MSKRPKSRSRPEESVKPESPAEDSGWTLYVHPLFLAQYKQLIEEVERLRAKDPAGYTRRPATKRLAAIQRLTHEKIPADPTLSEYRQGGTLGAENKHWLRAKFLGQYRLFFRYRTDSKIIVYVWVNDTETLRAYESSDDAYRTFARMLSAGHPPDNWDALLREAELVPSEAPAEPEDSEEPEDADAEEALEPT